MCRALAWLEIEAGRIWRSTDGSYAILAHTLPEQPPRTVYQARRISEATAAAYPERGDLGVLLAESTWCWTSQNAFDSAEAECERDIFRSTCPEAFTVPEGHPAVALRTFWWPAEGGRGALAVVWENDHLVAQLIGGRSMGGSSGLDAETTETHALAEINLTDLGVTADRSALPTTTDHGPRPCTSCGAKIGRPHGQGCQHARCLFTGGPRALCTLFGSSLLAGLVALATNSHAEFERYFRVPVDHDCGREIWTGEQR